MFLLPVDLVSNIDLQSVDVANIEKHIDTMYAAGQKLKAGIIRELERLSVQEKYVPSCLRPVS
jgi:hypothetical protein